MEEPGAFDPNVWQHDFFHDILRPQSFRPNPFGPVPFQPSSSRLDTTSGLNGRYHSGLPNHGPPRLSGPPHNTGQPVGQL
jgi:hypothetical protein